MTILDVLSSASRSLVQKSDQPRWIPPMLATLTEKRFSHPQWLFERKFDGVRCMVFRQGQEVRLMSRARKPMNTMFPELIEPFAAQRTGAFIVDGEIVAFDGLQTSFGKLQGRLGVTDPRRSWSKAQSIPVFIYLFDLLHVEGSDVTGVPLLERKKLLKRIIDYRKKPIRYSEHRMERGEEFLEAACRDGWEGLIAKQVHSPYVRGRSRDWLKFKCVNEQEFVVIGFTEPQGSRIGFGALLVGYYDGGGGLHYAGRVGTGYDDDTLRILAQHMKTIEVEEPLVSERDPALKRAHWIQPRLVAQVGFTEWTGDGRLRHPRFLGLRTDKPARNVVRERNRSN